MDANDSFRSVYKFGRIKTWFCIWILKTTHRLWNKRISSVLCDQYNRGVINSSQLHVLSSKFDPTQKHEVY